MTFIPGKERQQINGHTLVLVECDWRCLQCSHTFDAAVDAELFWCGDECRHYGVSQQ